VSTSAGIFDARAVVDASGRCSNLRQKRTGAAKPQKWLGLKAHYSAPEAGPPSVDLYFFRAGYCGVQPSGGGQVNVCAMVRAGCARSLEEVFVLHPGLLARSQGWKQAMEPVRTFPLIFRSPVTARLHVLHAGDAAGFVDPFVGDGIAIALRTGALAAQALDAFLAGRATLEDAIQRYRHDYQRAIQPVFRSASLLRRLTALPAPLRKPIIRVLQIPALGRLLVSKTRSRTGTEE
jgi:flavin-dependent dehydrogenase